MNVLMKEKMAPKIKKKLGDKAIKEKEKEEKENSGTSDLRNGNRLDRVQYDKKLGDLNKLRQPPPPLPPEGKVGFWCKKLQDLEDNETKTKNKQCGLYEFSGTDESEASFRLKKASKPKARLKKKRQPAVKKYKAVGRTKKVKEIKENQEDVLGGECIVQCKERKNLADKSKELTFTAQTFGITSTPAVNKKNLIGASNFLFLSPILKAEPEHCSGTKCSPPGQKALDKSSLIAHASKGTYRVETKLKSLSCRRVLRSGKMADL